jgi:hypothetical protein
MRGDLIEYEEWVQQLLDGFDGSSQQDVASARNNSMNVGVLLRRCWPTHRSQAVSSPGCVGRKRYLAQDVRRAC